MLLKTRQIVYAVRSAVQNFVFLGFVAWKCFLGPIRIAVVRKDKPCDQPLKYYMIATLLWSQVWFCWYFQRL